MKNNNKLYFKKLDFLRGLYFLKRDDVNNVPPKNFKNMIGHIFVKFINFDKFLVRYIKYCKKYENKYK